jgi:phosphate transport system permease protein
MNVSSDPSLEELRDVNYLALFRKNLERSYPEVKGRSERRKLAQMFSESVPDILESLVISNPSLVNSKQRIWVLSSSSAEMIYKGSAPREIEEKRRVLTDQQLTWLDQWQGENLTRTRFNFRFLPVDRPDRQN